MLSTLLVQVSWLPAAVLLLSVCVGPFIGAVVLRRPRLVRTLFVVSVVVVAALTLYPEGSTGRGVSCAVEVPYFALRAVESLSNVLLFIPPVLLAGLLLRRPLVAVLGGSITSAVIELLQALAPVIGRACDTSDWITNTVGSILGGLIAMAALTLERRHRRRMTAEGEGAGSPQSGRR